MNTTPSSSENAIETLLTLANDLANSQPALLQLMKSHPQYRWVPLIAKLEETQNACVELCNAISEDLSDCSYPECDCEDEGATNPAYDEFIQEVAQVAAQYGVDSFSIQTSSETM